jgi:hypothetical protein
LPVRRISGLPEEWPLLLYGRYEIREILTAVGWLSESRRTPQEIFHWQTQNNAGPDTPAGRRYIESPENGWRFFLFVRENKEAAYCALGPAIKVHIEGDRPMSLHWKLEVALPMELFRAFSVLRA